MKTYYDGEEREILSIEFSYAHPGQGNLWVVKYRRGTSYGSLIVRAKDELDAFNKFPEELAKHSVNYEDDNNVS